LLLWRGTQIIGGVLWVGVGADVVLDLERLENLKI